MAVVAVVAGILLSRHRDADVSEHHRANGPETAAVSLEELRRAGI